jgi:hypothetical protein
MFGYDDIFSACWAVMNDVGWTDFTLHHVVALNPQWSIQDLEKRFPTKHHIVASFSSKMQAICGDFASIKEGLFDAIMMRIDGILPHRRIIGPSFLDMPPEITDHFIRILLQWFNQYWSPLEFKKIPNAPGPEILAVVTLCFYRCILPYALTHDYDDTLARLDTWVDAFWSKIHPAASPFGQS